MISTRTKRAISLVMPGYGRQTFGAARAFWHACADMSDVYWAHSPGSLLAANFNQLWCSALNRVHNGGRVDYFAMLHDDVNVEDGWLDKLIEELEARSLDVLGAVVPIKDSRGMTSIAIRGDSTWRPKCRLSMREVYRLPETFTGEDVGGQLLLNTGCWVCKFDMRWAPKVHFEINDRIAFNRVTNSYISETEPEDWFFSSMLNDLGLKIGATRKVALLHKGECDFGNSEPWGSQEFDREHVSSSTLTDREAAIPLEV